MRPANQDKRQRSLAESIAFLKEKEKEKEDNTKDNSLMYTKNFSVPLKENVNKTNISVQF